MEEAFQGISSRTMQTQQIASHSVPPSSPSIQSLSHSQQTPSHSVPPSSHSKKTPLHSIQLSSHSHLQQTPSHSVQQTPSHSVQQRSAQSHSVAHPSHSHSSHSKQCPSPSYSVAHPSHSHSVPPPSHSYSHSIPPLSQHSVPPPSHSHYNQQRTSMSVDNETIETFNPIHSAPRTPMLQQKRRMFSRERINNNHMMISRKYNLPDINFATPIQMNITENNIDNFTERETTTYSPTKQRKTSLRTGILH